MKNSAKRRARQKAQAEVQRIEDLLDSWEEGTIAYRKLEMRLSKAKGELEGLIRG
jgi:exonuclease VII small subunit